ncbi:hypothetical protein DVH24_023361 [Malus domestica]|uniref:Uncharacterized protein n=1 Tax=Malus domestica TaxID=3750 RepID=A0A498KM14_MALDO|nr:hypothetical protein DVH24_023361 [Malus domestica]
MWVSNQQAFQQPCVPQKLSLDDQIAKLEESTRLFMESTPKLQQINSIDNLAQQIGQLTKNKRTIPVQFFLLNQLLTSRQAMMDQHTQDSLQTQAKVHITLPQRDVPEKAPKQSVNFNLLEAPRQPAKQQECMNTLTNLNTG